MIKFVPPYDEYSSAQTYRKMSFFNVEEDLLVIYVNPSSSRALGFVNKFAIPTYQRSHIDKIPS